MVWILITSLNLYVKYLASRVLRAAVDPWKAEPNEKPHLRKCVLEGVIGPQHLSASSCCVHLARIGALTNVFGQPCQRSIARGQSDLRMKILELSTEYISHFFFHISIFSGNFFQWDAAGNTLLSYTWELGLKRLLGDSNFACSPRCSFPCGSFYLTTVFYVINSALDVFFQLPITMCACSKLGLISSDLFPIWHSALSWNDFV